MGLSFETMFLAFDDNSYTSKNLSSGSSQMTRESCVPKKYLWQRSWWWTVVNGLNVLQRVMFRWHRLQPFYQSLHSAVTNWMSVIAESCAQMRIKWGPFRDFPFSWEYRLGQNRNHLHDKYNAETAECEAGKPGKAGWGGGMPYRFGARLGRALSAREKTHQWEALMILNAV